jgi:hypothetical protein
VGYLVTVESIYLISNMDVFMCSPRSYQPTPQNKPVSSNPPEAREGTVISTSGGTKKKEPPEEKRELSQPVQPNQKVTVKGKGGTREGTVISTSGGSTKFISNIDSTKFISNIDTRPVGSSSPQWSWHILLHLSHLNHRRQYKVHIKYGCFHVFS